MFYDLTKACPAEVPFISMGLTQEKLFIKMCFNLPNTFKYFKSY